MKKIILSGAHEYHIKLAGIVSALPFYRLVWLINNHLQLNLELVDDWSVSLAQKPGDTGDTSLHTCYSYSDKALEIDWSLVKNRGTAGILLRTKPLSDHVLVLKGEDYENHFDRYTGMLTALKQVTAIIPVDFEKLKDKDIYLH